MAHIAAANIEQPGDRIELGQQQGVGLVGNQCGLQLGDLVLRPLAGELHAVRYDGT